MKKSRTGFTIVELLIVIVVIAILAAITIVAYNGIQARARVVQQTTEMDKIGKAVSLWSAEKGTSLYYSGSGYGGNGLGSFTQTGGSYAAASIHSLLEQAGYLSGLSVSYANSKAVLLSPCTSNDSTRWVVYATFDPAPTTSITDQINATGCTNSFLTLYTSSPYSRNFVKAY